MCHIKRSYAETMAYKSGCDN